jgi:Holliday junction resolvase RusA-like endonuclease
MANKKSIFTLADLQKSKVASINQQVMSPTSMSETSEDGVYRLLIDPKSKPRMVRSDGWRKRPCVVSYWEWKATLLLEAKKVGLVDLPGRFKVTFHIPMPESWTKVKKRNRDGTAHLATPDCDNLLKALQDCLCKSDMHIHDVHVIKRWSYTGWIKIEL